jgi:class 3 adenylate cyclase/Tfp pilus assembly protein PilF
LLILLLTLISAHSYSQLQGQALVDSLVKELPRQKEDTNKVKLLRELSWGNTTVSPDEGIKYGQQSLDLATKLHWKKGMGRAYDVLGSHYFHKADYPLALQYDQKALKLYEEIGYKPGIGVVNNNLGTLYEQQGRFPEALEYFFKSLKIREEIGDKEGTARTCNNIGLIYGSLEDYPKALEYHNKSLKMQEEIGKKDGVTYSIGNIGIIYYQQNDLPKALEYFLKALKMSEELGNKYLERLNCTNAGNVFSDQKNYATAAAYYQRALKLSEESGDKRTIAFNLMLIGGLYDNMANDTSAHVSRYTAGKRPIESKNEPAISIPKGKAALRVAAIDYFKRALVVCSEINALELMQYCNQKLAEAYIQKGDYKQAMEYQTNYQANKDSIFSAENNKSIMEQGVKFEYEKKEAVAKAISEKEIQKQKLMRNGFMAGFAVVLLFAGIFFSQRNKIKAGKKQSDELLLNILPAEVAEELKAKGSAEAKLIDEVTVLFTDFKGFTQLSEKLTAKELVGEINECFSAFDNIMQKHGVEKIKTIGDAYMAAGGLPTPNKTHAMDVVKAALEIQDFMHRHRAEREAAGKLFFEIRIGVHSGPVVAGIVGIKKFAYDIWGDTVNTASRMESSGMVGKVNISETTYELVKNKFSCEYRGEVEAKGKGVMKMYFVG